MAEWLAPGQQARSLMLAGSSTCQLAADAGSSMIDKPASMSRNRRARGLTRAHQDQFMAMYGGVIDRY